jgi:dihydrofolate reductase
MTISMIAAVAANGVIGKDNNLAWHLPDEMKYFKVTTKGKPVIMGRKNWDSLSPKWRPLPMRQNIIITRKKDFVAEGAEVVNTIEEAINRANATEDDEIFIIGGGQIYGLGFDFAHKLYITEIHGEPDGDTFFPKWDKTKWHEVSRIHHPSDEKHIYSFDYVILEKKEANES